VFGGEHDVEEFKAEFARMSREEKQRFTREVGPSLCKDMMADTFLMQSMFPRCIEMMHKMPVDMRRRMAEMMREMERMP
jgi:hypothetical protein